MSDDLKSDLTDIDGVGEKTAEKIVDVIQEHDQQYRPMLLKAFEAAEAGDDRQAAVYLRRAGGE